MVSKLSSTTLLAALALFAAAPVSAQPRVYRVTELPNGPSDTVCIATAINDAGATAGSCTTVATGTMSAATSRARRRAAARRRRRSQCP